jgi:outer membrane lipoprotein-sorting protein
MTFGIRVGALIVGVILAGSLTFAQPAPEKDPVEEGARLIKAAIEARGGERYLGIKSVVATGQYTPFDGGTSTTPTPFVDTIVFPDKERTEFGKGKKKDRRIQVNDGDRGWTYDGDAQMLKDQNANQIRDFQEGLEYDIDHILRGGWRAPGVRARFSGREETRPGERADILEVQITPERKVFISLDRTTHLPMAVVYERPSDKGLTRNETRFAQYIVYDGVKFPNIVDFIRDGVQTSRINFQDIKLNGPIPADTFAKPESAKAVK